MAVGVAEAVDVDPRLLMAARCGDSERLKNLLPLLNKDVDVEAGLASLLPRVTMEGDTVLHVVAACCDDAQKFRDCFDVIVSNVVEKKKKSGAGAGAGAGATDAAAAKRLALETQRLALEARNNKDDTPLHCAASAGNVKMITCLVDLMADTAGGNENAAQLKKGFVKMPNECGETALHHAVRAPQNNKACIEELMKHDPDLACVLRKDGTSPLYLAISLGKPEIGKHMYDKRRKTLLNGDNAKLFYSGPDGRNALHAAVPRGQQALLMILGWVKEDVKPREDGCTGGAQSRTPTTTTTPAPATTTARRRPSRQGHRDSSTMSSMPPPPPPAAADCLLLSQLTSQRDRQQKGSTPLHLAASLEGWSSKTRFLFGRIRQVSVSATEVLLAANESTAYQADDQGWYPIHVAAQAGSLFVVRLLLERSPDCATLRDGEGRTFLHLAAEKKCFAVVRYVCRQMPQLLSSMILNAQDSNGDTPLHCAVRAGNLAVFNCLLRNPRVRLDVANRQGMTPLDLSWTTIPAGFNYRLNPRSIVRSSLLAAGAQHGGDRPDLFLEKLPKRDEDTESKKHTEATQVMSIVTALIATVTFASVFTLPGGYRDAGGGSAAGTPLLAAGKSYAFEAFILADLLSFIFSMAATCFLVYAGLPAIDIYLRNWYFNVSATLLQTAARTLAPAIALGLYLVLAPVDGIVAVAVCVIVFLTSLYGNMAAWQIMCMARTIHIRIGIPRPLPAAFIVWARDIFCLVLLHFGSYIIIFGLPAIRKWVIPAILKWVM